MTGAVAAAVVLATHFRMAESTPEEVVFTTMAAMSKVFSFKEQPAVVIGSIAAVVGAAGRLIVAAIIVARPDASADEQCQRSRSRQDHLSFSFHNVIKLPLPHRAAEKVKDSRFGSSAVSRAPFSVRH